MSCPTCKRENPDSAQFCIYCATRLVASTPVAENGPATGPTVRLDPTVVPTYTMPAFTPAPVPQPAAAPRAYASHCNKQSIGALWLIGLGILLLTGEFFPVLFALIGITSYLKATGRGHEGEARRNLMFFAGLAIIFWLGLSWPLLFLWLGIMTLLKQRHWRAHS